MLTNDAVQVSNDLEVTVIPRANISRLSFDNDATAPPPDSKGQGMGLLGYYFANTNVHGPVRVRLDPVIDFDWADAEPIEGIGKDYVAIIWMGYLEAPATGEFTFSLTADDQARLQISTNLVIEASRRDPRQETNAQVLLESDKRYPVTLLYQDNLGAAKVRLAWSGPDLPKTTVPADRLYPASFVSEHIARLESPHGLLATTYTNAEFAGSTATRVDPAIDAAITNATRWTAHLCADYSEPYTFYITTDGPVRLRLNGKMLIEKWTQQAVTELKATTHLTAGEWYDLQFETLVPTAPTARRLLWSSPSQPKAVVSATNLVPFKRAGESVLPTGPNSLLPPGVVCRNGSFLVCKVDSMQYGMIQCTGHLASKTLPVHAIARIIWQPLPRALATRTDDNRPGLLLANGDFVEGAFSGLEGSTLTINSVLLGLRTYDTKQVLAIILRATESPAPPCEIRLRDQSVLFTQDIDFQPDRIILEDKLLAAVTVPESHVLSVKLR